MRHSKLTATEGIHTVIAYTYADAAARTGATGFTVEDEGKFAKQLDTGGIWMLTSYSPVTWALGAGSSTPAAHAATHNAGGTDALAIDTVAATGSLRTLGTSATSACAGNDSRLSDARAPTSHASTHNAGGADALAIDAVAATGSLRTLGTSATSACAGNDSRLSNARTPTSHASTHNAGGADALAIDAVAATGSLRTLGTSATSACAGNDSRLSNARTPSAHVSTHLLGGSDALPLSSSTAAGLMPQSNFSATVDPTVSNDNTQGYTAGSIWQNTTAGTVWHAISVATGAAVWKKLITTSLGFINGGEAGGAARTLGNTDAYSLAFLTNNLQRLLINSDGSMLVTASTAASTAFAIKAAASQTGDLLMFQNSSGTELSCVTSAGWFNIAGSTTPFPTSPLFVSIATNSYLQCVNQNTSTGTSASTDFVATADNGSDTTNFVDLGINGSAYSQAAYNITGADDSYLLAVGGHLAIGTATAAKTIKFHTAGTTTTQLRATITDTALVMNTLPIQGVVDPTNAQDAATKAYVDAHSSGSVRQQFAAPDFDDPGTDWAVTIAAALAADNVNAAVLVRRFDDRTQEGVGWSVLIPSTATQVRFTFMSKALNSPSAPNRTVGLALKKREVPDNASLGSWASSTLTDLTITQDVYFHKATQTITLSTLSLTADRVYQLELVRQSPSAGTALVGDWCLMLLLVEWL